MDLYKGFTFRVAFCQGKVGICVDTERKYVARKPLPAIIKRNDFGKYKGLNCMYEYGRSWYEIKIEALNDLPCDELPLPDGSTLYENVVQQFGHRKSPLFSAMPKNCSVLMYKTSSGAQRNAPSGLCRRTYTTEHPEIKNLHSRSIKPPISRRAEIQFVTDQYLRNLTFGDVQLKLSEKPTSSSHLWFDIPKLRFANGQVLSVGRSNGAISTDLKTFGAKKKELLFAGGAFKTKQLDAQYFIMPLSALDTYWRVFLSDLQNEVSRLLPGLSQPYNPTIIPYDDSDKRSVYRLARAITGAVDSSDPRPGFAVAMLPPMRSTVIKEDELANIIMKKLRKRDFRTSIMHTSVPEESYEYITRDGREDWHMSKNNKQRSKIKGYLQGVAINKVLLLNSIWPFVLESQLNADLTIGIDVKNRVAGFTFIYKTGADFRFFYSETHDKERLSMAHLKKRLSQFLSDEKEMLSKHSVKNIVIHRQGRLFPSEIVGIKEALKNAAKKRLLPNDYTCTFAEVKKTSRVPFRLFYITSVSEKQNEFVNNPRVGTNFKFGTNDNEAFLCNTGYPYKHQGTTNPIHVIKIEGPMPMNDILQDVFFLANLTWTKIDDCSRDPLTIKMADIKLREVAGYYEADAYEFAEDETGGVDDE